MRSRRTPAIPMYSATSSTAPSEIHTSPSRRFPPQFPCPMTEAADFKEIVKQQADIVRIVGDYVKLRKSGAQNFSGLCPFHNEKTPSFSVHATRQFFHCFGCGASGDVFAFVQKLEGISFTEAVRLIADKLKIPLPKMSYASPEEAR